MNQENVLEYHPRPEPTKEDGMLFVRITGIVPTMVRASIYVMGLLLMGIMMPIQNSFSSTRALDLIIYPDGSTHVFSEIEVNLLEPDFEVNLFAPTIDNFVAKDENGFLLSAHLEGDTANVETFGSPKISLEYDTHDLVSKEGRIWTFKIDSPIDYTLTFPKNSVIVGMTTYPLSLQVIDERSKLLLPGGPAEINYIFGIIATPGLPSSNTGTDPVQNFDNNSILLVGGIIAVATASAAGIITVIVLRQNRAKNNVSKQVLETLSNRSEAGIERAPDKETIFRLRPNLREDDKEFVAFISDNGGKALESELRKKFLQPRTTMWRAVKRLERQGIVEIEKKDMQNLVKLKKKLEKEEEEGQGEQQQEEEEKP